MFQLAEFEKRAREVILGQIVEDYRRRQPRWRNEPALQKLVLLTCLRSWQNVALLGATVLVSSLWLSLAHTMPLMALVLIVLLAGIVEVIFLYMGCHDSHRLAAAVIQRCTPGRTVFALETIHTKQLRAKLCQALQYWALVDNMQRSQAGSVSHDRLARTSQEMTRWLQVVYRLAGQIDAHNCNLIVQRDGQSLPQVIQTYEQKLSRENNPALCAQLQQILAYKQQQLQTLAELNSAIEKSTHQLDSTIASMGVVYAQLLLLVSSRAVEGSRINRLQAEITEEVQRLEDLTTAIGEFTGHLIQPEDAG